MNQKSLGGRPRHVDPPVEKTISLPTTTVARVDIMLFSELENRVPHGAWSRYINALVREDLSKKGLI